MGYCVFDGQIYRPEDGIITTKRECLSQGGKWFTGDPDDPGGTKGICFVRDILTRTMGETIIQLGATYDTARALRDQILAPSKIGDYFLSKYYSHMDDTIDAARDDYVLIGQSIETWLLMLPFVETLLAADGHEKYTTLRERADKIHFEQKHYDRLTNVLLRFIIASQSPDYIRVLHELIDELERYIGKTVPEVLTELRRDDSAGTET